MLKKAILLFHTVKHLKVRQVYYRAYYRIKKIKSTVGRLEEESALLNEYTWLGNRYAPQTLFDNDNAIFLHEEYSIKGPGIWNDKAKSKLWLYNLHYLDDLNSLNADERFEFHLSHVLRWIDENPTFIGNGWEPYTLSLRLVNLIKWCSRNNIRDQKILQSIAHQANALKQKFEYHILANHLFSNAKALVFVGVYLDGDLGKDYLSKGLRVLKQEMEEQFLQDGAHFELSPMYHSIILWDVLELIDLALTTNKSELIRELGKWREIATQGITWLSTMCHPDGDISFFNDAAFSIAPKLKNIKEYAARLNVEIFKNDSSAIVSMPFSGFTRVNLNSETSALLINHAEISPSYQPGHTHADTLSFELSLFGQRVFVNTGTSQYGLGDERNRQRSTLSHNTLSMNGEDSSEMWSGFRVARRAKVTEYSHSESQGKVMVSATHDGYARFDSKYTHRRLWESTPVTLTISDFFVNTEKVLVCTRYHLHPNVKIVEFSESSALLRLIDGVEVYVNVSGGEMLRKSFNYLPEFGLKVPSEFIEIRHTIEEVNFSIAWTE